MLGIYICLGSVPIRGMVYTAVFFSCVGVLVSEISLLIRAISKDRSYLSLTLA